MELNTLLEYCQEYLSVEQFRDYCPNGLQVEGRSQIHKIATGVTACQALIDGAIAAQADVLLVHHGYFWKGEDASIVGMKYRRVKALMDANINLLAYHLPLDAHPEVGNNAQLAKRLGLVVEGDMQEAKPSIGMRGHLDTVLTADEFSQRIEKSLQRTPLHVGDGKAKIHSIAWCSGGAQSYIHHAIKLGVDAYLTGEVSEQTVHIARENNIHFFSAGHHATETYGVQALAEHLAEKYNLQHEFIDIPNPV